MQPRTRLWLRRALISLGCLALVTLLTFGLLERWVKARLIDYVGKTLGGKIDVGEVRLSLFRAQEIRNFLIRDPSKKSYIKIRSVRIEVGLLQVLGLGLKGKRLVLDRPEIRIVRDAQGIHIPLWQRFLDGHGKSPSKIGLSAGLRAARKPRALPWTDLNLEEIRVIDGRVILEDRVTHKTTRLNKIEIRLSPVNMDDPISLRLSCIVRATNGTRGKARLSGSLKPFKGRFWAGKDLDLRFDYKIENIELGPLSPFLPAFPVTEIRGKGSALGKVQIAERVIRGSIDTRLSGFFARGGAFPKEGFELPKMRGRLRLVYDGELVRVEQLMLDTPSLTFSADGRIAQYDWAQGVLGQLPRLRHEFNFQLKADLAESERLFRRFLPSYPVLIEGKPRSWRGPVQMLGRIAGDKHQFSGDGTGRISGEPFSWTLRHQPGNAPEGQIELGTGTYQVLPGMQHFLLRKKK